MKRTFYTTVCALALATTAGHAQVLTLATTNPGGTAHSIGSAIASTLTEQAGIRTVVVPTGGSPMPAVVGGDAECGINIAYDLSYYVNGTEYYEQDGKHENLRMVGAVLPTLTTMYAKKDSSIESPADLRGLRVPGGLNAQLAIGAIYEALLKLGGLTRDDVQTIPAQSIVQAADDFIASRNDTFVFGLGSAKVLEVDSSVGGLRALSLESTEETRGILADSLPGAYFTEVQPSEQVPQIVEPTNVITVEMVLFCADAVPDDTIYEITKAMHANKAAMAASFAAMNRFEPDSMAPSVAGVDYHPGAIRFYEEAGLWPQQN